jgi:hypothetical protein
MVRLSRQTPSMPILGFPHFGNDFGQKLSARECGIGLLGESRLDVMRHLINATGIYQGKRFNIFLHAIDAGLAEAERSHSFCQTF